ncbi:MAG: hypothetical protein AB1716_22435 [Planctomycetota bacterium]
MRRMQDPDTAAPAAPPAGQKTPPRALLVQFLAGRDTPCPVCRYNLRDLTSDRCPECGALLELGVGSLQARFGALVLAITPSVMTLTLALLIYALCLDRGLPPAELWNVWATMLLGPLDAGAAAWLYSRRVWFMRRSRAAQWRLVGLTWVLHGAFWVLGLTDIL